MRKKFFTFLALILSVSLILSCIGCVRESAKDQNGETEEKVKQTQDPDTPNKKRSLKEILADPDFAYPLVYPQDTEEITVSYFWRSAPSGKASWSETKFAENLYKETGIRVNFTHPPKGQETEHVNILIASGDLPDIMWYTWLDYPGGITAAIEQNLIIKLTDLVPTYAPNFYKKIILNGDEIDQKYFKNDDGDIVHIAYVRDNKIRGTYRGPFVRKDWLDKLKLDPPETIADWEEMLTLFKNEMGATAPFTARSWSGVTYPADGFLTGAFDFTLWTYIDYDGKVQWGYAHENLFEFLRLYKRWYDNGLIERDIANMDRTLASAKMVNGEAGSIFAISSEYSSILNDGKENNPEFDLLAVNNPVMNEGDPVRWGHAEWGYGDSICITTSCKYPELALRLIDYGFTEEGIRLHNFGEEGVTYYIDQSGKPKNMLVGSNYFMPEERNKFYTDEQIEEINSKNYINNSLPTINTYFPDEDLDPISPSKVWRQVAPEALKRWLPPISFTPQEAEKVASLENELTTYAQEMFLKFLFGDIPMTEENIRAYYNQLDKLGLKEVLEIKQAAVDRFGNR